MAISFDNIIKTEKAEIFAYNKSENYDLLSDIRGRFPREFVKLQRLLVRFGEFGEIKDENKFNHMEGNLYEFKADKLRVFCVKIEGVVPITIILHHFYKKQKQKTPKNELSKALRLSSEIIELFRTK